MATKVDGGRGLEATGQELEPNLTETERLIIFEIKSASKRQDVRSELLWIFTLGKIHNRWANSSRSDDCLSSIRASLDGIYSKDNVRDEYQNADRFLTTYENDIVDGSEIHRGKIKAALREEFNSAEFKKIIADSTNSSITKIFKDNKVQIIGSIVIGFVFFLAGKIF